MSRPDQINMPGALLVLAEEYGHRESRLTRTGHLVRARQAAGETPHVWMVRVEGTEGVITDQQERLGLAMSRTVNGLRSNSLRLSLLSQQAEWEWNSLEQVLQTLSEAVQRLEAVNSSLDEMLICRTGDTDEVCKREIVRLEKKSKSRGKGRSSSRDSSANSNRSRRGRGQRLSDSSSSEDDWWSHRNSGGHKSSPATQPRCHHCDQKGKDAKGLLSGNLICAPGGGGQ